MVNDVACIFICCFAMWILFLQKYLFISFAHFVIGLFTFFYCWVLNVRYIFYIQILRKYRYFLPFYKLSFHFLGGLLKYKGLLFWDVLTPYLMLTWSLPQSSPFHLSNEPGHHLKWSHSAFLHPSTQFSESNLLPIYLSALLHLLCKPSKTCSPPVSCFLLFTASFIKQNLKFLTKSSLLVLFFNGLCFWCRV